MKNEINIEAELYKKIGQSGSMHLLGWVHNQFPVDHYEVFQKVATFLVNSEDDEIPRLLDLGWWKVYDEMNTAVKLKPNSH